MFRALYLMTKVTSLSALIYKKYGAFFTTLYPFFLFNQREDSHDTSHRKSRADLLFWEIMQIFISADSPNNPEMMGKVIIYT